MELQKEGTVCALFQYRTKLYIYEIYCNIGATINKGGIMPQPSKAQATFIAEPFAESRGAMFHVIKEHPSEEYDNDSTPHKYFIEYFENQEYSLLELVKDLASNCTGTIPNAFELLLESRAFQEQKEDIYVAIEHVLFQEQPTEEMIEDLLAVLQDSLSEHRFLKYCKYLLSDNAPKQYPQVVHYMASINTRSANQYLLEKSKVHSFSNDMVKALAANRYAPALDYLMDKVANSQSSEKRQVAYEALAQYMHVEKVSNFLMGKIKSYLKMHLGGLYMCSAPHLVDKDFFDSQGRPFIESFAGLVRYEVKALVGVIIEQQALPEEEDMVYEFFQLNFEEQPELYEALEDLFKKKQIPLVA